MSKSNMIRCIPAQVFKCSYGDASNGGISTRNTEVLIPSVDGNLFVDMDDPPENLCLVVRRNIRGREFVHLVPNALKGRSCMNGGTFVYSSDARFEEAIRNGGYPVSLHDRVELF